MSDAEDLYQHLILDHSRHPRNTGPLPSANRTASRDNPLCGDRCSVALELDGDRLAAVRFDGSGCAISMASASMMTVAVDGRTRADAASLAAAFDRVVSGAPADSRAGPMGDLQAFATVARYPVRVRCARLPWQALLEALKT
jgi:nitrogen fixation NifU-like protein